MAVESLLSRLLRVFFRAPYASGFFIVSLILLTSDAYINYFSFFSADGQALSAFGLLLFLAYAFTFLISKGKPSRLAKNIMKFALLADIADFLLAMSVFGLSGGFLASEVEGLMVAFAVFMALLPVFVCGSFAALFSKRWRFLSYLFIVLLVFGFAIPIYSIVAPHSIGYSDEIFIAAAESNAFLGGLDPYSVNVSRTLYNEYETFNLSSFTLTASNQLVGTLNYPALYLFASVPLYELTGLIHNVGVAQVGVPTAIFLVLVVLIIAIYAGKDFYKKPALGAVFFLAFLINAIVSPIDLLMLALIILAYVKLESKYSWILLGLCVSVQELLWLPVLLLIAYSANNYGMKKGLYNTIGAAAIFLIINSYFMLMGPEAFIKSVLNPVGGNILPNPAQPFGYLIAVTYGTAIGAEAVLVVIAMLAALLLFFYFNNKKMVAFLALLPILFMSHGTPFYSAMFIELLFVTLAIREKGGNGYGVVGSWLRENPYRMALPMALLVGAGCLFVISSHAAYSADFGPRITITGSAFNASTGRESYAATLYYPNSSGPDPSVLLYAETNAGYMAFGLFNGSIMENPAPCPLSQYSCLINANRVALVPGQETYNLSIGAELNSSQKIYRASVGLYTGNYAYLSEPS